MSGRTDNEGLAAHIVVRRGETFNLDVELDIDPGTTVALLGPNGSGKSTTVEVLAGLLPLDRGQITLAGRVLDAGEAERFGLVARVFDDAALAGAVGKLAAGVAASGPVAMRLSKRLIRHGRDAVAEQMAREAKHFAAQLQGPEFAEAVAAMAEKRLPDFG